MRLSKREIEERVETFTRVCRTKGVKLTPQRLEIYRELAKSFDHPDAEAILAGVRRRVPSMSLDTVYRTLWLLIDFKLIGTLGPARERTRFDANLEPHHHFVCERCGLTRDFYSDDFDRTRVPAAARSLGRLESIRVEVNGICSRCLSEKSLKPTTRKMKEKRS